MSAYYWIIIALVAGVASLAYGWFQISSIMASPAGNPRMQEIARAIQEGADAYLKRQYTAIAAVCVGMFVVLLVFLGLPAF